MELRKKGRGDVKYRKFLLKCFAAKRSREISKSWQGSGAKKGGLGFFVLRQEKSSTGLCCWERPRRQETGDRRGQRWHLGSGGMGWVSLALGEFENSCSTYRTPGRRSPCCKVGQCEVGICKSSPLTALIFLTEAEAQHEEERK